MRKDKRMQYEGSPIAQMVQATRKAGRNITSTMRIGTITSPPPEIKMLIDHDPEEYDKDEILVAEKLTVHMRNIDVIGNVIQSKMTPNGTGPHMHEITHLSIKDANITFNDELQEGDRVLVECDEENDIYIIMDRVVSYK